MLCGSTTQVWKWKPTVTKIYLSATPCVIHYSSLPSPVSNKVESNSISKEIGQQVTQGHNRC